MDHEYKAHYKLKLKKLKDLELKNYHEVTCPKCQTNILGDGININDKIAKCDTCGVVFSFQNEITHLSKPQRIKQEIIRPEGIDIFHFQNELDFSIQRPYSIMQGIFGGIGIPFALIFTVAFLVKGGGLIFPALIFWLMSIYPIYSWATHSKRKLNVNIDNQSVNIQWKPKGVNKDKSYDKTDIDQLYIKTNPNTGYYDIYMVVNGLEGQKHVRLIPNLDSKSKALYMEQEIEKHLGIIDREVLEETKIS